MNSQTEENYLKALFTYLAIRRGERSGTFERLEIKMPTVTSMMKNWLLKISSITRATSRAINGCR